MLHRFLILVSAMYLAFTGLVQAGGPTDLPAVLKKRLDRNPERFLRDMADLIAGYGHDGALDAAGVEAYIGLERARVRAFFIRQLLQADLNGDGNVARAEIVMLQAVKSATLRGRLELQFRSADKNRDGTVSGDELRADAAERAIDALPPDRAAALRAVMAFDADDDGTLALDEVLNAVDKLQEKAA